MQNFDAKYDYRAIVFALRGPAILDTHLPGKKLLGYRSVVISEHPPSENSLCEWEGLHYHGIVEHPTDYRFDSDRIFNQFKAQHCEWFKSERCKMPVNFAAYMQIPPRRICYRNFRDENSDLPLIFDQVTDELLLSVAQRKDDRVNAKKEGSNDIMYIKDLILKSNAQSESELVNLFHDDSHFEQVYCKRTFTTNFKKALTFAIQQCLDTPIRTLCCDFKDQHAECLQPSTSAELMEKWFRFQGICPQTFVSKLLQCLDRQKRKLNTFVLIGEPNSGKTFIAKSLQKACRFYGEISQGTAGYAFMWQDCVNKRLIVINEPYFDECMVEQLKVVLEGTGTFVHKKNCSDEYLRPTPVVITANYPIWNTCLRSESAIRARCIAIYDKLKSCDMLSHVKKDLHPMWLSILAIKYARAASPVSDFDDLPDTPRSDECIGPGISTVDRVLIPENSRAEASPLINSTSAAENTTSTLNPSLKRKKLLIDDSLPAPKKKVEFLGTSSPPLFDSKSDSEDSTHSSTKDFPVVPNTPPERQGKRETLEPSPNTLQSRNYDPEETTLQHLEQDLADYTVQRPKQWKNKQMPKEQEQPLDLTLTAVGHKSHQKTLLQ